MSELVYKISTGELTFNGNYLATGYSGYGEHKNNPDSVAIPDSGPIPIGLWSIGNAFDSTKHGPFCLPLTPSHGTETHGRSGFLIHGDSIKNPGNASLGCVIIPREVREFIAKNCKVLTVEP